jgi:5'-3' exonuclease
MGHSDGVAGVRVVLAVDGNSLAHRAYHAAASSARAVTEPVWAVRGLITQIVAAVERVGADAVVVGFDDPEASMRRDRWPQYKMHRTEKAQCLVEQLAMAADVLRQIGLAVVMPDGLEADDVLASVAAQAAVAGAESVIMTSDRDSFALIDATTSVLRIINGGVEASPLLTAARLPTLLGISGAQYRDFAALRGDPSDNLPGVRGIGPKTAAKLLAALGTAEAAFDDLVAGGARVVAAIGAGAAGRLAAADARASWQLNCAVMDMRTDVALGLDFEAGGAGVLPLATDGIRQAYASLRLIYSLPAALRVLADAPADTAGPAGPAGPGEVAPSPPAPREPETAAPERWFSRPQRFPRLPSRAAEPAVQLSLFA